MSILNDLMLIAILFEIGVAVFNFYCKRGNKHNHNVCAVASLAMALGSLFILSPSIYLVLAGMLIDFIAFPFQVDYRNLLA